MTHDEAWERLPELVGLRAARPDDDALQRHLVECPDCQTRLAALDRVAGALRQVGAAPLPVPPAMAQRVLAIPAAQDRVRRRLWRRRWQIGIPALAAAAAAVVVLIVTLAGSSQPSFTLDRTVALHPMGAAATQGHVDVGMPSGHYRIVRVDLRGLPASHNETYDLWMMDGGGAMKAGTFGPDPDGHCQVELMVPAGERWTHLAVTRSGDSPSDRPLAQSLT